MIVSTVVTTLYLNEWKNKLFQVDCSTFSTNSLLTSFTILQTFLQMFSHDYNDFSLSKPGTQLA